MPTIEHDANDPRYIAWKASFEAYKVQAAADRVAYLAVMTAAVAGGLVDSAAAFTEMVRYEVDEDLAANDSRVWVRGAEDVFEVLSWGVDSENNHDDAVRRGEVCRIAMERWHKAQWNKACDHALDAAW